MARTFRNRRLLPKRFRRYDSGFLASENCPTQAEARHYWRRLGLHYWQQDDRPWHLLNGNCRVCPYHKRAFNKKERRATRQATQQMRSEQLARDTFLGTRYEFGDSWECW